MVLVNLYTSKINRKLWENQDKIFKRKMQNGGEV